MRFKNFYLKKQGIAKPMLLKALSDGEHQLLHSIGLCLLFRNTNSLFLLDEPETHFNPAWRASFISRICSCLQGPTETSQEMLITTHSPFLISDSKPDKVLVFDKNLDTGSVSITHPRYNTLGASINKITHETFEKSETIGEYANQVLNKLLSNPLAKTDPHALAQIIMDTVGDSIERTLAIHTLLHFDQKTKAEKE
jgi:restriction system-associated AAA family ATPase